MRKEVITLSEVISLARVVTTQFRVEGLETLTLNNYDWFLLVCYGRRVEVRILTPFSCIYVAGLRAFAG